MGLDTSEPLPSSLTIDYLRLDFWYSLANVVMTMYSLFNFVTVWKDRF